MRIVLLLLICCLLFQPMAQARDYVNLHLKEMRKAEKFGVTDQYFADYSQKEKIQNDIKLKDPKLVKLGGYDEKTIAKYSAKVKKDELEYAKVKKYLASRKIDNFNSQAYPQDFYTLYRVAERIIRANKLDYINWRIVVDSKKSFNASSEDLNCLTFNTGLIDTFKGNEDALAFVVAHEMAHSMFGHEERLSKLYNNLQNAYDSGFASVMIYYKTKYRVESRNAEYAADVEAVKYIVKAQYDINKAKEALSTINTMDYFSEGDSNHPSGEHRLENFEENLRYFMLDEWVKQGKQNLVQSEVLKCEKSSNRKSIVLVRGALRNSEDYYRPEEPVDIFKRVAYNSYLDKDMKKASKYFKKWAKLEKTNAIPYLYLSYIQEYLYTLTEKEKFLVRAHAYIDIANSLDSKNTHIKKQQKQLPALPEKL